MGEKSQHFSILDSKKILFKMLSNTSQVLRLASNVARIVVQRNLATSYVAANKAATDPVQGLFVEKIREYATKKKAAGGKFVDATKQTSRSRRRIGKGRKELRWWKR